MGNILFLFGGCINELFYKCIKKNEDIKYDTDNVAVDLPLKHCHDDVIINQYFSGKNN